MKERHNQLISKGGTKANQLPLLLLLLLNQNTMKCKDNPNISQSWHNQYISVEDVQKDGVCQLCCMYIYTGRQSISDMQQGTLYFLYLAFVAVKPNNSVSQLGVVQKPVVLVQKPVRGQYSPNQTGSTKTLHTWITEQAQPSKVSQYTVQNN